MIANRIGEDIRPGEEILANRIRMCLPARCRDAMLPKADEDLVRRVRAEQHANMLRQEDAKRFTSLLLLQHADEFQDNEWDLAYARYGRLFCQEDS